MTIFFSCYSVDESFDLRFLLHVLKNFIGV